MLSERIKQWLKGYYSKMKDVHKMVYDKHFNTKKFARVTKLNPTNENSKQELELLLTLQRRVTVGISSQIYFVTALPTVFIVRQTFPKYGMHSLLIFVPGIILAGASYYLEMSLRKHEHNAKLRNKEAFEKYK
eukprot:TRINITY_DN5499_c0_g2_i1.p1 TRINITY_DN5499_c0_g2~~TRINITY_DN5499_c0_g2_i1.p1  ORF type:complete len:133 (-),score=20.10 TRINITY_DN5499_c0_g2_i1:124-522(-)